jgi:hypothetical protein
MLRISEVRRKNSEVAQSASEVMLRISEVRQIRSEVFASEQYKKMCSIDFIEVQLLLRKVQLFLRNVQYWKRCFQS